MMSSWPQILLLTSSQTSLQRNRLASVNPSTPLACPSGLIGTVSLPSQRPGFDFDPNSVLGAQPSCPALGRDRGWKEGVTLIAPFSPSLPRRVDDSGLSGSSPLLVSPYPLLSR
jgi:hypothetical protein